MSELEKKFSDFQQSECKDFELDSQPDQGEKFCPTCVPNPNFILPDSWWNIRESYLNEAECEYHVAVYPSAILSMQFLGDVGNGRSLSNEQTRAMLDFASEKILKDLKKPYNTDILKKVQDTAFVKDGPYINLDSPGPAFLIAVQAFNIDSINDEEVDEGENETSINTPSEVIVKADSLSRDIRQLRLALALYENYYSIAQQTAGSGFVIMQENNTAMTISYQEPRKKLREIRDELNYYLRRADYSKLQSDGIFTTRSKRAKSLKFIFKEGDLDYDLDDVYVLSDRGCSEYEPLGVKNDSILKNQSYRIVFHFFSRLETMVSEFQAKEPKPWAEWTLDHWYPTMELKNKTDLELEEVQSGLECLIEQQLGNPSAAVDFLAKEIMSGFKTIQKEAEKNACRELNKRAENSATSLAQNNNQTNSDAEDSFKAAKIKKYENEFKNKFYNGHSDNGASWKGLKTELETLHRLEPGSLDRMGKGLWNLPQATFQGSAVINNYPKFPYPTFESKKDDGESSIVFDDFSLIIDYEEGLNGEASKWANAKFNLLNDKETGSDEQNSPHWGDVKEAYKEAKKFPENGIVDFFKNEDSWDELKKAFTLCNTSKVGKKAAECILGNISISDFYDAMIDKLFEFMSINTLDLFLAGIPASVRADFDEAIQREFGGDTNLFDLIAIKKVNEGGSKLSDITKTKNVVKEIRKILDKHSMPSSVDVDSMNEEELTFFKNNMGDSWEDNILQGELDKVYSLNNEDNTKDQKKEKNKSITNHLKRLVRDYKKEKYGNAFTRATSFTRNQDPGPTDPTKLSPFEEAAKKFDETAVGQKVDVVFDVVFDFAIDWVLEEFSIDELIEDLRQYPVLDFIGDQILNSLSCPTAPIVYPPPQNFMKGLTIDLCDNTKFPEIPKIVWPNINPFVAFKAGWSELIREQVIQICETIIVSLVKKLINLIESSLCAALGLGINALGDFIRDGGSFEDTLLDALNEAFCNSSENPENSRARAEELAQALFTPLLFEQGVEDIRGASEKIVNIISSVASADEFLNACVARDGDQNSQFERRIANAVNTLTPEAAALLGSPSQVGFFFRSIGSFLSSDDRERIRDLLDRGIPNLPISKAICLTDDQLDDWNDLRKELLREYPNPEVIVEDLNERTLDAAGEVLGIIGQVDSPGGPFVAPLIDEINKDPCNPNHIVNDVSQSDLDRALESDAIDSEYENLTRIMKYSFMRKNGILGLALRDKNNNSEFKRAFYKFIFPGYTNSEVEWQNKYDSKRLIGQTLMNNYNEGSANGIYPETVGLKQREDLISGMIEYDFEEVKSGIRSSRNVVFKYKDEQTIKYPLGITGEFQYRLHVAASLLRGPKKIFGYNIQVLEKTEDDPQFTRELNFNTPVDISTRQMEFMSSIGFQYKNNNEDDIRKEAFNSILRSKLPLNRDYRQLYEKTYEVTTQNLVEALLTDERADDNIPAGYKFGYVSDNLTKDSFKYYNDDSLTTEYNLDEEEQTLGVFGSTRILALDPAAYGGRYSKPKYYIEPRQHKGWVELAAKAFDSLEGCDPKTPPLLDMSDIKNREKNLANTLRNDPRLSRDPDCINDIPFKALLNSKMQAKMDGIVRSTLRTYLAEFFMKGYGLFSNLQIRFNNFDQSMPLYIANQMKKEMVDLGSSFANRKIRIVKERYWYTFLEQCVEAYQRMTEVDGVEPPDSIATALAEIQLGLDQYQSITRAVRRDMRKNAPDVLIKPPANFDPLEEASRGPREMAYMAMAFRISEDRENFFNGGTEDRITKSRIRTSSIKKLNFFQKIYFIRLYEKQATLIMSEIIRNELNRLNTGVVDGLTDKPYYYDLYRSFPGMKSFFPTSNSKVGTNNFYSGIGDEGDVPEISSTLTNAPTLESEEPQFLVEKYVRFVEKNSVAVPRQIRNRALVYRGAVSFTKSIEFLETNMELIGDNYLSDFFGDLEFTYTSSFKGLMDKGFANNESIQKLNAFSGGTASSSLLNGLKSYLIGEEFDDFDVQHDASFLLEGETPEPTGTTGSTGVKHGLRISLVLPDSSNGGLSEEQKNKLRGNFEFMNLAAREKSYIYEDGTVVVPLVYSEVDVIDSKISDFDPSDYDLECLINKMVEQAEFQVIFDKILNLSMTSSMLAIYCMETMIPSFGRYENEREEEYEGDLDADDWDGTINKFVKNMLRKKFKSVYLSSNVDGLSPDEDDDSERGFLRIANPLDNLLEGIGIKIPWWKRRRRVFKAKDRFGEDCSDPTKDFR